LGDNGAVGYWSLSVEEFAVVVTANSGEIYGIVHEIYVTT